MVANSKRSPTELVLGLALVMLSVISLNYKALPNLALLLNATCSLQQLRMFFNYLFDLFTVCKYIEPRCGRGRKRCFSSTLRVVSLTTCMLSMYLFKTSTRKTFKEAFDLENFINKK